ncbi:unnamed protein product [Linum tenue]|uniref:Armadillo repeat-containing protein 6 n=1 Tax=Linum tenue TaxID=586396 RepID=A0AAV0MNA5_9ROSI|nr:unnamed protein product [Linum tenue]
MAPPSKNVRSISQEAFDELVKENMEDLGMEPAEALEDAIQSLSIQGVDLSGIVKCVPGEGSCIERLNTLKSNPSGEIVGNNLDEMAGLLRQLIEECSVEGSGNVAVAVRNGGVETITSLCSKIPIRSSEQILVLAFGALALLIHDIEGTEKFRSSGGPAVLISHLREGIRTLGILNSGFSVVARAATSNEVVKQSFMELKIDELILQVLNEQSKGTVQSLYDAIRVLLTPDDNRVVASEDEICKSIAESGGIDMILKCIDDSGEQGNSDVARTCCSLLSKLAGSDSNKAAIVEKKGMVRLIQLSSRFADDPLVLLEVMSIFTVLSLRSPDNAARAMEAGAGDLAIQAMKKFHSTPLLQRNACMMIRNLAVRNLENRTLLLGQGIEKCIRRARENHGSCKAAATDALRDLGLDNYNS